MKIKLFIGCMIWYKICIKSFLNKKGYKANTLGLKSCLICESHRSFCIFACFAFLAARLGPYKWRMTLTRGRRLIDIYLILNKNSNRFKIDAYYLYGHSHVFGVFFVFYEHWWQRKEPVLNHAAWLRFTHVPIEVKKPLMYCNIEHSWYL